MLLSEREGQIFCTCSVLVFSDFNIQQLSIWSLWLIVSFLLMLVYEVCWIRYLRKGCLIDCLNNYRTYGNTYSTFKRNKEIILNYHY
ncbi:Conserved hypothetical protein [Clostridium acetobutylicum EA 2018]|uniref:Uncharacterized protein n=1 Tax=Clostridium acetobutylicum (strain ATCC 824 / DSM 792 / JCM 1419 / IAM 19013 / LMG 5710 / NBRC 13948 / NRRL B-527 / VKM B-1787 / 2291 / W) TaxID=272562 RepID=Q97G13_CLOAB|nr:Hypothetical protein CA_C2559 [Clostridium acetobutylicum ATCC 824]ADZ21609.1 Conserved hypothetical protein [Clostridium acetobutylicum EA 2018]AEI32432.1 hypothetical protein SMB_G2594 [Clostridium acetobutylicum DSM 1731]AWV82197.1 hypothetical protein DK921_02960 [Clostridium acetobutylicum]PSM07965.1 hypothetical protein C7T89_02960 [Clostridium sp. NJ4]